MGQAKNRGTYEERLAQAQERHVSEQKALADKWAQHPELDPRRRRGKSKLLSIAAVLAALGAR